MTLSVADLEEPALLLCTASISYRPPTHTSEDWFTACMPSALSPFSVFLRFGHLAQISRRLFDFLRCFLKYNFM